MDKKQWFQKEIEEVEKELQTDLKEGLSEEQVLQKREKYGLNELQTAKKEKELQIP